MFYYPPPPPPLVNTSLSDQVLQLVLALHVLFTFCAGSVSSFLWPKHFVPMVFERGGGRTNPVELLVDFDQPVGELLARFELPGGPTSWGLVWGGKWLGPAWSLREHGASTRTRLQLEPRDQLPGGVRGERRSRGSSAAADDDDSDHAPKRPAVEPAAGEPGGAFERRDALKPHWVRTVSSTTGSRPGVQATFSPCTCSKGKAGTTTQQKKVGLTSDRGVDEATIELFKLVSCNSCYINVVYNVLINEKGRNVTLSPMKCVSLSTLLLQTYALGSLGNTKRAWAATYTSGSL